VFKRNPDYWGRDLPVKRGMDNFDEVRLEYFRDQTSLFEAFKKGLIDVYPDGDPNSWSSAYDFPAVRDGRVVKDVISTGLPKGMNGFVFNTRRPIFADVRVREALAAAFDFEWMNQNLFFGLYRRSGSYFQGSELSALGVPASEAEKALLAPFPNAVRADVMDGTYKPVATDGSGRDRAALRRVIDLLAAAGWTLQGGAMKNAKGEPLTFELLITTRDQERLALAYQRTLKTIGIDLKIRSVESQQFQQRRQMFDFDMTPNLYAASLSPGNEQLTRWGAASADQNGSFNFAGAREPAIDAMIQALLAATDRESFIAATRAYDRVLISGFYVVPLFHLADQWLARWTHIERPEPSLYGSLQITWWRKPAP
jgi:peptide/nickel transport system substrate-binding protein